MNVDGILEAFNAASVDYLLIGVINYLLRHEPVATFDVDFWIKNCDANCRRCERALCALDAAWGASAADWRPVRDRAPGWLGGQAVYCLASPEGAIDVFLAVTGLDDWRACRARAVAGTTAGGVSYWGLCDADMLRCQEALPVSERKPERLARLRKILGERAP